MKNFLIGLVFIIVVAFIVVNVAGYFLGGSQQEITLDFDIILENEEVMITGETNFEDGTILSYEIDNYQSTEPLDDDVFVIDENFEVIDGQFEKVVDLSEYPTEGHTIEVWLSYHSFMQPDNIIEIYGEEGENLSGDLVENGRLVIIETFEN